MMKNKSTVHGYNSIALMAPLVIVSLSVPLITFILIHFGLVSPRTGLNAIDLILCLLLIGVGICLIMMVIAYKDFLRKCQTRHISLTTAEKDSDHDKNE